MAIVKCKECGAEVSTKAKACPKCGAKPPKKTSLITWLALLTIVVVIWLGGRGDSTPSSASAPAKVAAAPQKQAELDERSREILWLKKGKEAVKTRLKDPRSAEFKDVFFFKGKEGVPVACGQVNAKNSLGGYTGFKHFVSAGSPDLTYLENEVTDFAAVWKKFCAR